MKTTLILLILGMVPIIAISADKPAPELARVLVGLHPIFTTLSPYPEVITSSQESLTISDRSQTFKIYDGLMTGEFARSMVLSTDVETVEQADFRNGHDGAWPSIILIQDGYFSAAALR